MDKTTVIEQQLALMAGFNIDQLLEVYRAVDANRKTLKARLSELDFIVDHIEVMINNILVARGEDGAVTTHGKVQRKLSEQFYAEDKIALRDWATAVDKPELLNISLAVRAFNSYIEQQRQDDPTAPLPPGVGVKQKFKLSITK